jgi:predicted Ser/Thr protein kinase
MTHEQQHRRLGKYEILEELGRGSFGVVYKGRDTSLDRLVALKVLHPQLAVDPSFVQRFYQEARAAASLDHAHIVTVYEVGEEAGQYYLAMAYLPGRTLDKWLDDGPLSVEQAVAFTQQIAGALDAIHDRGLVHRDVKPANIMVDDRGGATLLDFGIVRAAEGTRMTASMAVLGTPEYMAPEQAQADEAGEIDRRADVYALGVVAYEMLVGRAPFTGTSATSILYKHVHEPPPAPTTLNPALPPVLAPVLLKALAKRRDARFQRASDLATELRQASLCVPGSGEAGARQETMRVHPVSTGEATDRVEEKARRLRSPDRAFWLGWVAANTAGWVIGLILGGVLLGAAEGSPFGVFLGAVLLGLSIGTLQWFALRRRIQRAGRWVGASLGGTLLGSGVLAAMGRIDLGSETWGLVLMLGILAIVFGACVGIAQWFVLRNQFQQAGWWIVASLAAWAVAGIVDGGIGVAVAAGFDTSGASSFGEGLGQVIAHLVSLMLVVVFSILVISGPVSGAITGAVLIRLLRHPKDAGE